MRVFNLCRGLTPAVAQLAGQINRAVPMCVRFNSQRAAITKTNRTVYARAYPTLLVQPDGSTITVRYHIPRKIITMPVDLSSLTPAERQARLNKRKPKQKIVIEDDIEDSFDANQYSHLWKKK